MTPLEVYVLVKQIPDPAGALSLDPPQLILNPPDRTALEEALRLQKSAGARVTAVTLGPLEANTVVRLCLAAGVDAGLHLVVPAEVSLSLAVAARVLADELKQRGAGLILCGEASLDEASAGLPAFLAEELVCPAVTRISKLELAEDGSTLHVQRQQERGSRALFEVTLPAVVSLSTLANLPRYISVVRQNRTRNLPVESIPVAPDRYNKKPALQRVEIGPPRPRPTRIPRPAASLGASARLSFMMAGGQAKKESPFFEGSPAEAVDRIIQYLKDEGLLQL